MSYEFFKFLLLLFYELQNLLEINYLFHLSSHSISIKIHSVIINRKLFLTQINLFFISKMFNISTFIKSMVNEVLDKVKYKYNNNY